MAVALVAAVSFSSTGDDGPLSPTLLGKGVGIGGSGSEFLTFQDEDDPSADLGRLLVDAALARS
jgi:hypothetical protein